MRNFFHAQVGTFATDKEEIKCGALLPPVAYPMPGKIKVVYEFGRFRLDATNRVLQCDGKIVSLSPKALDLLLLLVRHRNEVLDKQKIMEVLWGKTNVEERNLTQQIFVLRKALGDGAEGANFIATIPKRGYRFVAEVVEDRHGASVDVSPRTSDNVPTTLQPSTHLLKFKIAAVLVLAFAGALLTLYLLPHFWRASASDKGPIRSIAVLPLENLSADIEQKYFADGITEAVTGDLAQVGALRVISRSSSMQYRGTHKTVPQIARELHVDGIVQGTIARSGERVRVTAELLDARTDTHVWAQSYERDLRDLLSLQSEVASDIAEQVAAELTAQQRRALGQKRVVNPAAHEAYLKGRFVWNERTEHSYLEAIRLFNEALSHDPVYANAYAGLADAYALLASLPSNAITRTDAMEKARAAATRAIELDPDLAEAHTSLAFVLMHYDWKFVDAEKEFQLALRLNPNYATAHQWYAYDLMAMGRTEESLEENQRAEQNDPLSLIIATDRAELLLYAGKISEAIRQGEQVIGLNPNFPPGHQMLAFVYAENGDIKRAETEIEYSLALTHHEKGVELTHAYIAARSGDRSTAIRIVNQVRAEALQHGSCGDVASVYMALNDRQDAYTWLEHALQQREGSLILLRVNPTWQPIRSDRRFADLLPRIGLVPDRDRSRLHASRGADPGGLL